VFVGVGASSHERSAVALGDVAKQQTHSLPLEVQGASTGPWLRENFAPVEPPQFTEPGIALLGARLLPNGIANHDAALLQYLVSLGVNRLTLTAVVLKDLRGDELSGGQAYQVGDLILRVHNQPGGRDRPDRAGAEGDVAAEPVAAASPGRGRADTRAPGRPRSAPSRV
jgi:hypothetical protein